MAGMSRASGRELGGDAHLKQSIGDILSTPIGTRVMRRDYGSLLFEMTDQPANARTRLRLYAAIAVALLKWEPRLIVTRLGLTNDAPGRFTLSLEGRRTDTGPVATLARLTLPIHAGAKPVLS
ncbi:MAG: GPW/gp25 family protein [Sphingomonadaceae bacterium]|nr:GPW/gp25 family protein [Sphingomonadaceae bacterium]